MLWHIFKFLSIKSRMAARLTCRRWAQILHSDHFIADMRVIVSSENLTRAAHWDLVHAMKRYRRFTIRGTMSCLAALRRFLYDPEVAQRVEELKLDTVRFALLDLFFDGPLISMPNLRKLIVVDETMELPIGDDRPFTLDAPNLTHVEFYNSPVGMEAVISLLAGQVQSMVLQNMEMAGAFEQLYDVTFDRLTELSLIEPEEDDWEPEPLSEAQWETLGQLRRLKFVARGMHFVNAFPVLLEAATSLECLHIDGSGITREALLCLNNMPHLQQFYMQGCMIGGRMPLLALNSLQRLTVTQQLLPLNEAVRLSQVDVKGFRSPAAQVWHGNRAEMFFRRACSTVRKLTLSDVTVSDAVCKEICSLRQIESLTLVRAFMTTSGADHIHDTFKHRARMYACFAGDDDLIIEPGVDEEGVTMEMAEDGQEYEEEWEEFVEEEEDVVVDEEDV